MMDVDVMVNATKRMMHTWDDCCADMEREKCPAEVCNAICEIDKAIIALTEKIGNCARACTIAKVNGRI